MAIDVDWALQQLQRFVGLDDHRLQRELAAARRGGYDDTADHPLVAEAPVVEQILDRVTPTWRSTVDFDPMDRWLQRREASLRAMTMLSRADELRQRLGDDAPTLNASRFHPWAWGGARSMWGSQQYAQAVVDALKKVNAEAQLKVGRRDVTETELFNQLFSLDAPKADKPRLRLMPNDGSDTYSSVHRGARALAEGLFAGVRNRHSHEVADTPAEEQHSLEQLAAVSVLARWVDDAEVVTAP